MGTRCTCGQGHETFGACIRAKGVRVGWSQSAKGLDATEEKNKWRELNLYKTARDQGIQPGGTQEHQVRAALDVSDKTGRAFNAETFGTIGD